MNCIFCSIASGEIPTDKLYEDDNAVAFRDIDPQAPQHVLIVTKEHVPCAQQVAEPQVWAQLMTAVTKTAEKLKLADYRLVINNGKGAGQSVEHLHVHILAGRELGWPPG